MILTDFMGHMVSTESADELHRFAEKIGLKRSWYQTPSVSEKDGRVAPVGREHHAHYDLTTDRMKAKALRFGAKEVSPFDLVKRAWWNK